MALPPTEAAQSELVQKRLWAPELVSAGSGSVSPVEVPVALGCLGVERRSHSDTRVGCMVWLTTATNSAERVSRSTSSRRRALNAATVLAAS